MLWASIGNINHFSRGTPNSAFLHPAVLRATGRLPHPASGDWPYDPPAAGRLTQRSYLGLSDWQPSSARHSETRPRWARGSEKQARWARRFQTSLQREAGLL
jgi:hypothetical protein